ncbi:hypothetical protein F5Y08DRAFT_347896 [Xylaria arbuscula]|nr:hypothetical protein F5Y08DRAFT_347896 [Xylaria arbuscula]
MNKKSTPDNHYSLHTPSVDWRGFRPPIWHWPYSKLNYTNPNDIWDSLYEKFNCMKFAIQDPRAWHADVCELALQSHDKEEFETALKKRRDERFNEILENWEKTCKKLAFNYDIWKAPPAGPHRPSVTFRGLRCDFSFDSMVGHFGNYVVDDSTAIRYNKHDVHDARSSTGVAESYALPDLSPGEQHGSLQQPTVDPTPSNTSPASPNSRSPPRRPSPIQAPASTPEIKSRRTRTTRKRKGPTSPSRVEKSHCKEPRSKTKPQGGVRRSARLQAKADQRGG